MFREKKGTLAASMLYYDFYKKIKENCPETVFHATDVGHQYYTTGKRCRKYLVANDLMDTEMYKLTLRAIEQGGTYYQDQDYEYRESKMFDKLENEDIIGGVSILP